VAFAGTIGKQTVQVATGGATLVLSGQLSSGGAGLSKTGAGTLLLSGNNIGFNGGFAIQGGVLRAGSANALASSSTVTVTSSAATLDTNDQILTITSLVLNDGALTTGTGNTG